VNPEAILDAPRPTKAKDASAGTGRQTSVDVYRGFVMFLMMAEVLRLCRVASALPGNRFWQFLCYHQSHVEWIGCSLHDMIQPSFSFLVGVALPYSIASRLGRGQRPAMMSLHALWRSILLILLGVFLRSTGRTQITNWTFEDTLSQIGLGYIFLFLLGFRQRRDQWIALGIILVGYWAAFAMYPLPPPDFDYTKVGVPKDFPLLSGLAADWNKNSNLAWAFDTWFLNLFRREKPFLFNGGGYATLSFIPTLGTMILGLIAGGILRSERPAWAKLRWFAIAGVACLLGGATLNWLGICPVVKRIWTPSWVLYSGGWCFLLTGLFYLAVDVTGHKKWSFPLMVIGMNSIAAYCIAHLFEGFILKNLKTHLGQTTFEFSGRAYEPFLHGAAALLVMWLLLFWMYRRKLFLRI
jgi:heparan-alpha-glucosaminide N-acetyltransferase